MDKPRYKNDALRTEAYRIFSHCDFRTIGEHTIASLGLSTQSKLYCTYKRLENKGLTKEFFDQKGRLQSLKFCGNSVMLLTYEKYLTLKRYFDAFKLEEGLMAKPKAQSTTRKAKI